MKLDESFLTRMREASRLLRTEGPMAATDAIKRALGGAAPATEHSHDSAFAHRRERDITPDNDALPDFEVLDIDPLTPPSRSPSPDPTADVLAHLRNLRRGTWAGFAGCEAVEDVVVHEEGMDGKGRFVSGSCTNAAGTRNYKLYIPSTYAGQALPLVVMLHGCTQNPDDFALGTGMNAVAEEHNCFVVYPEQTKSANGSNCWNWFQPAHQQRNRGEPSILADIVRKIGREFKIDERRIYAAGLSAGGAMAATLGATYPDLFAAIGIHSGLPHGAAHDVPSAFAVMKSRKGKISARAPNAAPLKPMAQAIPVIVFHGDSDHTVHQSNGDKVLRQCLRPAADSNANPKVEQGRSPGGRSYTRAMYHDAQGKAVAEHWTLHGGGHAWAGGRSQGSYTDPGGPDASREMLRFFFNHAHGLASAA